MTDYTNENEQWEAIRDWWRKNGWQMVIVFAVSLAAALSWRYWQAHQLEKKYQASQLFDQLLATQSTDPNAEVLPRISAELENNYSGTVYAPLSALFAAKNAIEKNDVATAEQKLTWALDHVKANELGDITRIRLARVLLAEKKFDQALAVLAKVKDDNFSAAAEQVKGDIYLAQGQGDKARAAYQNALNAMPSSSALRNYVQMQVNQNL